MLLVTGLALAGCSDGSSDSAAPPDEPEATEEFGMTEGELSSAITAVEAEVALCMADQGWEYEPLTPERVSELMDTIHTVEGLSDEEYVEQYGFGVTTQPFQQAGARVFGANVDIFLALDAEQRTAYEAALLGTGGEIPTPTFVVALDAEDLSETGGCTRTAVEQVFEPDEVSGAYLNPVDQQVQDDPRVVEALVQWSDCMALAGYPSFDQESAEDDLRGRLAAILQGRRDLATLTPTEQQALEALQDDERAIAAADQSCADEHLEAVVDAVELEVTGVEPD
jgi:hypothetical protein